MAMQSYKERAEFIRTQNYIDNQLAEPALKIQRLEEKVRILQTAAMQSRGREHAMARDLARCLWLLEGKGQGKGKDTDKGKGKGKFNWEQRPLDNGGYKGKPLAGWGRWEGGNWVVGKGGATAMEVDLEAPNSNKWGARV